MHHPQEVSLPSAPMSAAAWIQAAVLILDGSESMTWQLAPAGSVETSVALTTKAAGVDVGTRAFVDRMTRSSNAASFRLGFVAFNDRVTDRRPLRTPYDIPPAETFDPTANGTGGTAIYTGIDAAIGMIEELQRSPLAREIPVSVVAALLSDGEDMHDQERTKRAAAQLRELPNTKLATCLFATAGEPPHGEALLQEIVSEPGMYQRVFDADQLRDFFIKSFRTTRPALMPPRE